MDDDEESKKEKEGKLTTYPCDGKVNDTFYYAAGEVPLWVVGYLIH